MGTLRTLNATFAGPYRRETLNGRKYIVAPFTSLGPRVLNGSKGPLYYPASEIERNPGVWNGIPLTNGHPVDPATGLPQSGREPAVMERDGLGYIYRDRIDNGWRKGEAWFDEEWTRNKAPVVYAALNTNSPIELSTGLFTDDVPAWNGLNDHEGRPYTGLVATNYRPDHLAVLTNQRGACSRDHGCGIGLNAEHTKYTFDAENCPKCGASMEGNPDTGKCNSCGYKWGAPVEQTTNAREGLIVRAWQMLLNAFVPNQPRSAATGRVKLPNAGTGTGDEHTAAQGGYFGSLVPTAEQQMLGADAKRQKDDEGYNPPNWAIDEALWEKAKQYAADNGHGEDWPYVVGIYERMGGKIEGAPTKNRDQGTEGTDDQHQGDDDMNRNQMIAFLVANCDCWKGKQKLLENKELFDDTTLNTLVTNAKTASEATATINAVRKDFGIPDTVTANEMPAALKAAMDKKSGDDDEEETEDKKKKATENRQAPTRQTYEDWVKSAPPEVVERDRVAQRVLNREKGIVINRLTDHIADPAKKKERVAKLNALSLDELYDRLADMPTAPVRNGDSGDRFAVLGGGLGGEPEPEPRRTVTANIATDEDQLLDVPVMNWDRKAAGSRA